MEPFESWGSWLDVVGIAPHLSPLAAPSPISTFHPTRKLGTNTTGYPRSPICQNPTGCRPISYTSLRYHACIIEGNSDSRIFLDKSSSYPVCPTALEHGKASALLRPHVMTLTLEQAGPMHVGSLPSSLRPLKSGNRGRVQHAVCFSRPSVRKRHLGEGGPNISGTAQQRGDGDGRVRASFWATAIDQLWPISFTCGSLHSENTTPYTLLRILSPVSKTNHRH
ncbi:hypothetical protein B0T25DRAFT_82014 [Lasiosphaeria hispida]|uniref:Uncharacterized protein n=1 Tax=Lasiosphaeria hispida TaxID=260671 RepID=A0AAJ0HPS3_9PEZI|nr:hypothetical protein B0T25DRAFT_82014 [Lasiosphaeria hispida]